VDKLTADHLLRFASTLEGERLSTLARGAEFTLRVLPAGVEITPTSSGEPRLVSREIVQAVCDEYLQSQSLRPSDYKDVSFDASYLLAVIGRYSG
jgi:hypothetical protein